VAYFSVTNATPYHWSDYHFEFYNDDFSEKKALPVVALWANIPDSTTTPPLGAFHTGEAVFLGTVVASSTIGLLPKDFSGENFLNADGLNFYGSPGVDLTEQWSVLLSFNNNNKTLLSSEVCQANGCNIGIRQVATTVPEPGTILGVGTAVAFGASFKHRLAKGQKKAYSKF
jgi:hypothetical protein